MEAGKKNKNFFRRIFGKKEIIENNNNNNKAKVSADASQLITRQLFSWSYNGERTLGELEPVKNYGIDYITLRQRAYDAYLTNEAVQILVNRKVTWVIGKGLKLQAEPIISVLKEYGINIESESFCDKIESRFNIYSKSNICDYSGMRKLSSLSQMAYKNAQLSGDVLVVLRVIDKQVKIQLIDGVHVRSQTFGSDSFPQVLANGNRIMNGVEMDETGKHVAYHILNSNFAWQRIEAWDNKTGLRVAYFVNGLEYRINNNRAISVVSAVLQSLSQMSRYKDATLGNAEERAKIPFAIEHDIASTGENPFLERLQKAHDAFGPSGLLPENIDGQKLASDVAVSTNKTIVNLNPGAKIKPMEGSKSDLFFKDFYTTNLDLICATFGIPPEVAMSKYDSNFSSARAAIKDWEHTLQVERDKFAFEFLQHIYNYWLVVEVLSNRINIPNFVSYLINKEVIIVEAFRNARWVGAQVPHINPLIEVEAERLKLGSLSDELPLTTLEQATENLNGGESRNNLSQYAKEIKDAAKLGIKAKEENA